MPQKKLMAIKSPPATTSGSIADTPLIKCLYTPVRCSFEAPPDVFEASYTGASCFNARLMSSSGFRIPCATGTSMTRLPAKRSISTALSAATMIAVARSISARVNSFLTPVDPFVSTLISTPISSAFCFKLSSAIYV